MRPDELPAARPDPPEPSAGSQLAQELQELAAEQARRRRSIEERWYRDTRQYYGHYDEGTEKRLAETKGASRLFVNLTRPKTRVMRSRLADILFPSDEANWSVEATPVPDIEGVAEEEIERGGMEAARAAAEERAKAMSELVADQLEECGYAEVGRRVVEQACKLGTGVCKGPFARSAEKSEWVESESGWFMRRTPATAPAFEFVDVWNFLPDMDAESVEDCEFVFEIHRMTKRKLRRLARVPGFLGEEIRSLLLEQPQGGELAEGMRDLRLIGEHALEDGETRRYWVLEYHGPVPAGRLRALARRHGDAEVAASLEADDPLDMTEAVIWCCQGRVLRYGVHHLDSEAPLYSVYRLDPADGGLFGHGIPAQMRDPQSALNAAWRMCMENGGLSGVPMFVVDRASIQPAEGGWEIAPRKVWYREGSGDRAGIEAVRIDGNTDNLVRIIEYASRFCDDETNLPLIAQGDQGAQVAQTAHGMSLLVNAVNIVFRNAARAFDAEFTLPNIRRLYEWNMQFGPDAVKGDMRVKARGSSVLMLRELQAQNLLMILNLAASNPLLSDMVRVPQLARRLFAALQVPGGEAVLSDEELGELARARAEQGGSDPELEAKLQLERARVQGQLQLAEMHKQTEILRLAAQQETTVARIQADLEKARLTTGSKERLTAAEFAVKERQGSGI